MPNPHPRPWRRDSIYGDGPRRRLDREQRARFRFLLNAHRRARRLTPTAELVGSALVRRLGVDGQLDPSHDTIGEDAGCSSRTVRRALAALKAVGLVMWQCRLVRDGWRVTQTSNSYLLVPAGVGTLAAVSTDGQNGRQTKSLINQALTYSPMEKAKRAAQDGLAVIAVRRMRALGLAPAMT
jgi:hypothetical protein